MTIFIIGSAEKESGMGPCGASGCTVASRFCALLVSPTTTSTLFCGISWWFCSSFCWGSCVVAGVSYSMASIYGFGASSSMGVDSTRISSSDGISSISMISEGCCLLSSSGPCDLVWALVDLTVWPGYASFSGAIMVSVDRLQGSNGFHELCGFTMFVLVVVSLFLFSFHE
jgi:hypothetical protein